MRNKIIPYNPILKEYARKLRKNSTLAEVLLWQQIKQKALGVQFHRQVPLLEYIVDFYCHELKLAIEVDGESHEYKYESDTARQGILEKQGVRFIRFSDNDVKKNMFNVGLSLEETIKEMSKNHIPENSPKVASSVLIAQDPNNNSTTLKTATPKLQTTKESYSFSKKEKLKSKKLIEKLFVEGKSVSSFPIKLIYIKTELPTDAPIQAGVTVPKKNFKSAVDRNRIKRLLREGYRLNKAVVHNNSKGTFAFLFLYLGKDMPNYDTVNKHVALALHKFKKKIDHE